MPDLVSQLTYQLLQPLLLVGRHNDLNHIYVPSIIYGQFEHPRPIKHTAFCLHPDVLFSFFCLCKILSRRKQQKNKLATNCSCLRLKVDAVWKHFGKTCSHRVRRDPFQGFHRGEEENIIHQVFTKVSKKIHQCKGNKDHASSSGHVLRAFMINA